MGHHKPGLGGLAFGAAALLLLGAGACDDGGEGGAQGTGGDVGEGLAALGVRLDLARVDGPAPPPNPVTGDATPDELNGTTALEYRLDASPALAAEAVVVLVPGLQAGAKTAHTLSQAIVRRAAEAGRVVEVWAIDRRSNALEDLRGFAAGDAEQAAGYYRRGEAVDGVTFDGYPDPADLSFVSEWGLATQVNDLRAVIARVPAAERRARVFLAGHSLGASFVETYAAWRFEDGTRGVEEVAGLVLLDGVLAPEPVPEAEYREGAASGFGAGVGLDAVREGRVLMELPLVEGTEVFTVLEIQALRTLADPTGVVVDPERDRLLSLFLLLGSADKVPRLTNRAALGMALDDDFVPLDHLAASLGQATGGPLVEYTSLFTGDTKRQPSDPDATYDWIDAPDADPPEHTPIEALARAATGDGSNMAEWYFPLRLLLDLAAVGGAAVPEDGWQAAEGLRAFDGALIDAPILSVPGGLYPEGPEAVRDRVAATVGEGRPHAGATRDTPEGWRAVDARHLRHVDVVLGADAPGNPVPPAVVDFVLEHAPPR